MEKLHALQVRPGFKLTLTYENGAVVEADFRPVMAKGGVFKQLSSLKEFKKARVSEFGDAVEFPCGVDFCAQALLQTGRTLPSSKRRSTAPG